MNSKEEKLKKYILEKKRMAVAFSGGVDSSFLLFIAHEVLGDNVLAVTLFMKGTPEEEKDASKVFCKKHGIRQLCVNIDELLIEGFAKNPPDRCFICKKAIFKRVRELALQNGFKEIADGSNADDLNDYRPGMKALKELNVFSPLLESGMTKKEIRDCSKRLGLQTWDAPSSPCLSSRIPYGELITEEKIMMIERAEKYLKENGFVNCRVRTHERLARIELDKSDFDIIRDSDLRNRISNELKKIGYNYVSLDLIGFRSGSLNEVL